MMSEKVEYIETDYEQKISKLEAIENDIQRVIEFLSEKGQNQVLRSNSKPAMTRDVACQTDEPSLPLKKNTLLDRSLNLKPLKLNEEGPEAIKASVPARKRSKKNSIATVKLGQKPVAHFDPVDDYRNSSSGSSQISRPLKLIRLDDSWENMGEDLPVKKQDSYGSIKDDRSKDLEQEQQHESDRLQLPLLRSRTSSGTIA